MSELGQAQNEMMVKQLERVIRGEISLSDVPTFENKDPAQLLANNWTTEEKQIFVYRNSLLI